MNPSKRNPIVIEPLEQGSTPSINALRSKAAVSTTDSLNLSRSAKLTNCAADSVLSSHLIDKSCGNRQQLFYVGAFRSNGVTRTLFLDDHVELAPNTGHKRNASPAVVSISKPIVERTSFGGGSGIRSRVLPTALNPSNVSGRKGYLADASSLTAALAKYLPITREQNSQAVLLGVLPSQTTPSGDNANPSQMVRVSQPTSSSSQTGLSGLAAGPPNTVESRLSPEKPTVTLTKRTSFSSALRPVTQPLLSSFSSDGVSETYGRRTSVAPANTTEELALLSDREEKSARPGPAHNQFVMPPVSTTVTNKTLPRQTFSGMYTYPRGRSVSCNSSVISMQTEKPIVCSIVNDKMNGHCAGDVRVPELYNQAEHGDEPQSRIFLRPCVRNEQRQIPITSSTGNAMPSTLSQTVVEVGATNSVAIHGKNTHTFPVAPNPVLFFRQAPNIAVGSSQIGALSQNSTMQRSDIAVTIPSYLGYDRMHNSRYEGCNETNRNVPQTIPTPVSVLTTSGYGSNFGTVPPFLNRITPHVPPSSFHHHPVPSVFAATHGALPTEPAPHVDLIRPTSSFKSQPFVFPVGHSLICVPQQLTTLPSPGGNLGVVDGINCGGSFAPQQLVVNSSSLAIGFGASSALVPLTAFSVIHPIIYQQQWLSMSNSLARSEDFEKSNNMETLDNGLQVQQTPSVNSSCQWQQENQSRAVSTRTKTSNMTQHVLLPSVSITTSSTAEKPYNLRHSNIAKAHSFDNSRGFARSRGNKKLKNEDICEYGSATKKNRVVQGRRQKLKVRFVNRRTRKVTQDGNREAFPNSGAWSPPKQFPAAATVTPMIPRQTQSTDSDPVDLSYKRKYQCWQQSEPIDRPPLEMLEALCLRLKTTPEIHRRCDFKL